MSKKKPPLTPAKNPATIIRSSAAEYLTFIAASGHDGVQAIYADENVWLTQKMMGLLYDVETHTINYHLKTIFNDDELEEDAVIRKFRITAADGKNYNTQHYNRYLGRSYSFDGHLMLVWRLPDWAKVLAKLNSLIYWIIRHRYSFIAWWLLDHHGFEPVIRYLG